jgi:hypothetical protein
LLALICHLLAIFHLLVFIFLLLALIFSLDGLDFSLSTLDFSLVSIHFSLVSLDFSLVRLDFSLVALHFYTCYAIMNLTEFSHIKSTVKMFTVDDGNHSTYHQRARQHQARPTDIIPALNGHGEQKNFAGARGMENIIPTPSTPTVTSLAAKQQQLQQQQLQQQQQAAIAAAQGAYKVVAELLVVFCQVGQCTGAQCLLCWSVDWLLTL